MKAVILAGGFGTRISEETVARPKPMVEIGGKPILWHIMKNYSACGIDEFVICVGYKGYMIKEFFANYYLHTCDVTFHVGTNEMEVHRSQAEPWSVTLVDTGEDTMTGGRLGRALPYVGDDDFCFTYGDGVTDMDIRKVIEHHRSEDVLATMTTVQPPGRFGAVEIESGRITRFHEKPIGDGGWINGGFFVLSRGVDEYIAGDGTVWEQEPMERLAAEGKLAAYPYRGFWHAMDTVRDRNYLQRLWDSGEAPWKTWD